MKKDIKPLHKIEPSDFGTISAYSFFNNYTADKKTGLIIKRWIDILDKKGGEVCNTKEFSSETEMKKFVDDNLTNGILVLDGERLYYANSYYNQTKL